jgi:hypothetical protein
VSQIASSALYPSLSWAVQAGLALQPADGTFRQLREEYQAQQALYDAQPLETRHFLNAQAQRVAQALVQGLSQLEFALPEQVSVHAARAASDILTVPPEFRRQAVTGRLRLPVRDIRTAVRQRLNQLEQSSYTAVATCAKLIRYATVWQIVHDLLPDGNSVSYLVMPGEGIPGEASTDAADSKTNRFFMPQWVVLDENRLTVDSIAEAIARVAEMQKYVNALHLAVSLAPYIFADEVYQRKRYGMLGQLIHQGRALALYETNDIIGRIQRKVQAGELNMGFSLSLPYLDDQMLEMKMWNFDVVPPGRIMFVPAFVVLAARREQSKIAQDMHLSYSTRMHLISELKTLERAFESEAGD